MPIKEYEREYSTLDSIKLSALLKEKKLNDFVNELHNINNLCKIFVCERGMLSIK